MDVRLWRQCEGERHAYSKVLVHDRASLEVGVVEVDDAAGFAPTSRRMSPGMSRERNTHAVIRITSSNRQLVH